MRGLAEFIMRGRWQAQAVDVIGSVLVSAAPGRASAIGRGALGGRLNPILSFRKYYMQPTDS